MAATQNFFTESRQQSQVKSAIVTTYFQQWTRVMKGAARQYPQFDRGTIAYIDLFAGPGRYEDGTPSTPLLVLEKAVTDPEIAGRLLAIFNERDRNHYEKLCSNIQGWPNVGRLRHQPILMNLEVGTEIARELSELQLPPTLLFADPWGYKGLSVELIDGVVRQWGCDCIIFFNYNRVNAGINNEIVREHMDALFGTERAAALRVALQGLNPVQRETRIVEALAEALQADTQRFVLPFCFKNEGGTRTTHHLVFVSKNFRAYEIMKCVMAGQSSSHEEGVASFEYCPASETQGLLFELNRPLADLAQMLRTAYAGRTLTMAAIHAEHSAGRPYTATHYKAVLSELEEQGLISTSPPAIERRKMRGRVTFADHVQVTFPRS